MKILGIPVETTSNPYVCEVPGCQKGIVTGHMLVRVSPKGGPFRGRCIEHFTGPLDQIDRVAKLIEDENLK